MGLDRRLGLVDRREIRDDGWMKIKKVSEHYVVILASPWLVAAIRTAGLGNSKCGILITKVYCMVVTDSMTGKVLTSLYVMLLSLAGLVQIGMASRAIHLCCQKLMYL